MKSQKGQAAVEFALVLPILILLICGVIDFGRMLYTANSLTTVCEQGARYASIDYTTKTDTKISDYVINNASQGIDKTQIVVTVKWLDNSTPPIVITPGAVPNSVEVSTSYTMTFITPFISNLLSSSKIMNFSSTCRVE